MNSSHFFFICMTEPLFEKKERILLTKTNWHSTITSAKYPMRKHSSVLLAPPLPQPRIFKIVVREDKNEVGLVVAYPSLKDEQEANVKGQIKTFPNEFSKLEFLVNAKEQGFKNFETTTGKIDIESMVLAELARRSKMERQEPKNNFAMV